MKKLISLLLAVLMSFSIFNYTFAEDLDTPVEEELIEEYSYCSGITNTLTISSNTATCRTVVTGMSGVTTAIFIMQTLEKVSGSTWGTVAVWSNGKTGTFFSFVNKKTSLSKGTFRLKTYVKVYNGSKYETITKYTASVKNS